MNCATTMELSKEQLDFLNECEEEFQNRYTDADEDFLKVKLSSLINPPILDPWPAACDTQTAAQRSRRDSINRHSQRRDDNRGDGGRYKEDRERYRDGQRRKRGKRRNAERSADRREKDDRRTAGDRKRHKDRRSEDEHRRRRGDSYRGEDRNRRYNNHGDRRRNRDNYREREKSKDRQKCREGERKEQDAKGKVCGNKSPILEQNIWKMYVSKHDLYENYRPYF